MAEGLGEEPAAAEQDARNQEAGMMDLFGGGGDEHTPATAVAWKPGRDWNDDIRLNGEKDTHQIDLLNRRIDVYTNALRPNKPKTPPTNGASS